MMNFVNLLIAQQIPMFPDAEKHPEGAPFWFPPRAAAFAGDVDFLYSAIFWICTVFFIGIVGAMCYLCVKYRRRPGVGPQPSPSHNTVLELAWSILPSILLVWMFWEGARGYYETQQIPDDAEKIVVTASQFSWEFTYPDGDKSTELHLVEGRPVRLVMESRDVLHSMYVAAFRQKKDIVPGRYTDLYFLPTRVGKYRLACAEYCGEGHSRMRTLCQVHPDDQTRKDKTIWIKAKYMPWKNGARTFNMNCAGCHGIKDDTKTGPPLNQKWGEMETLTDGTQVKVDETYVRESLLTPDAKIVANFSNQMLSFKGKLNDQDILELIAFLEYLKSGGDPAAAGEVEGYVDPAAVGSGEATTPVAGAEPAK